MRISFLGTGSAFPRVCYNSCSVIQDGELTLLVDAGGGNEILRRLTQAGTPAKDIRHFIITHVHTDHILGGVWVIRSVVQAMREGKSAEQLNIYANTDVIEAITTICRLTLHRADFERVKQIVDFNNTDLKPIAEIAGHRIEFFNTHSENVNQTGFRLRLNDGRTLTVLGDEALTQKNISEATGTDILICGAFCRYADREIFQPYEKHHWTVADVAKLAEHAGIQNLILVHCEDHNLNERETLYREEASQFYSGNITITCWLN